MKIGLIGDVHAEDECLAQALAFLREQDVAQVLCTGDIVDGRGCAQRCIALLKEFDVQVVAGNHDRWLLQDKARHIPNAHRRSSFTADELDYLASLPQTLTLATPFGRLRLCHGVEQNDLKKVWPGTERMPVERSRTLDRVIAEQDVSYFINGHMHYRCVIHFERMTLINAGTLRPDHKPGISILDLANHTVTGYEFASLPRAVRCIDTRASRQPVERVYRDTQAFDGNWQMAALYA